MYKVLIVEDEDTIRKGLTYAIDWPKVNCVVIGGASDGIDGLNKIREFRPHIVITDVRMPIRDGLWMLEESIFEFEYEAIIISGYGEFEYAKKAISLGVHEYLLKPINFEQLYEIINCLTRKIDMKKEMLDRIEAADNIAICHRLLDFEYYDSKKEEVEYVPAIIEYIQENYSQKISLSNLSNEYYISSASLNSKFKEATNYTFNDFLNRYRIQKSVQLLKTGKFTVAEVAKRVGFSNYKYFHQVFRKYVGCSPTQF